MNDGAGAAGGRAHGARGGGFGRGRGGRGGRGGGRDGAAQRKRDGLKEHGIRVRGKREEAEIAMLERRIKEEAPAASGIMELKLFDELPISNYTKLGLRKGNFTHMTQIQRAAIMHALAGRDVLGAAKTGSGKTLAFLIPVVERLYRAKWTGTDGLGAIIISPTRELALQIFEVLKIVCQNHFAMTAGYVTGGKSLQDEQENIARLSILVCTPGRLLQHLEQTADLDASNVQMLVLDEADRLLDMGFEEELNSILSYLPSSPIRQTLLFSATQTKSVRQLAKLSLHEPEYVAVHEASDVRTPVRLSQYYVISNLQDKVNLLYSFIKSHLKCKIIVFVSSCKQVRYLFESFRRLRPGVPLMELHGKIKQERRTLLYYDFVEKPHAVLFSTDIAARGLDFPDVDWVVQFDCPENVETYIHRVGRTARYRQKGKAMTVLLPSEVRMLELLQEAKIPIEELKINPNKALSITGKLAAEVAADKDLKYLAQRCIVSYLRSVFLQPLKDVFKVSELPVAEFAQSLGLAGAPDIKILKGTVTQDEARTLKNKKKKLQRLKATIEAAKAAKKVDAHGRKIKKAAASDSDSDAEGSDSGLDSELASSGDEDGDEDDDEDVDDRDSSDLSDSDEDSDDKYDSDEDSSDDELLQVKRELEGARGEIDTSALVGDTEGLTPLERARILKVARQTKDNAATGADAPFAKIAGDIAKPTLKADNTELFDEHEKRVAAVRAKLAATEHKDKERERQRVRKMHLEARIAARGKRNEEEGGIQLATSGEPQSASEDEAESDSASASGSGSESESEAASDAESQSGTESDSDDASETSDQPPSRPAKRSIVSVEDAEAAALRLLQKRRLA